MDNIENNGDTPYATPRGKRSVFSFAQDLVSRNNGKARLSAQALRSTGENVLALKDPEYRRQFINMLGSTAIGLAGLAGLEVATTQASTLAQAAGAVIAGVGLAGQGLASHEAYHRYAELSQENALQQEQATHQTSNNLSE